MASAEEEVRNAIEGFYLALDKLLLGKGTQAMREVWHHTDYVTTVHPLGHWARGWKEVWSTWEEIEAVFGIYQGHAQREDRIGGISDLRIAVVGDVAYGISVFRSCMYLPDGPLRLQANCTNILERHDGVWKIIHHHPDQAPPDWQAAVGRMVERGRV